VQVAIRKPDASRDPSAEVYVLGLRLRNADDPAVTSADEGV